MSPESGRARCLRVAGAGGTAGEVVRAPFAERIPSRAAAIRISDTRVRRVPADTKCGTPLSVARDVAARPVHDGVQSPTTDAGRTVRDPARRVPRASSVEVAQVCTSWTHRRNDRAAAPGEVRSAAHPRHSKIGVERCVPNAAHGIACVWSNIAANAPNSQVVHAGAAARR